MIEKDGQRWDAVATLLSGSNYESTWAAIASVSPIIETYQGRVERQIPPIEFIRG